MRSQVVPPPATTPSNRAYSAAMAVAPPPSQHPGAPGYRDLNTPIKLGPSPPHHQRQPVPKYPSTVKKAQFVE